MLQDNLENQSDVLKNVNLTTKTYLWIAWIFTQNSKCIPPHMSLQNNLEKQSKVLKNVELTTEKYLWSAWIFT